MQLDNIDHVIKENMTSILFLENHTQNVLEKLFPDPFLASKLIISLDR